MNRRTFLATLATGNAAAAGCLRRSGVGGQSQPTETRTTTERQTTTDSDGETAGNPEKSDASSDGALTDWERSTDCENDPDEMYDSVVSVNGVRPTVDDDRAVVRFDDLPADEREILGTVTTDGGYATCDGSAAFDAVLDRLTDSVEDMTVYLERDGEYYRLYVEAQDQVYAY